MNITDPVTIDRQAPYRHLYSPGFFPPDLCADIYDYFESADAWHKPEGAAPDDGPIWFMNQELPDNLKHIGSAETIAALKNWLAGVYGVSFGEKHELIANKMMTGQGIRPHNDFHDAAPSHRIVIFITRDWSWGHGGELWLLKSRGQQIERSGHLEYPPLPGDAVTFGISEQSYHAVELCTQGVRYSLTYSFWPGGH